VRAAFGTDEPSALNRSYRELARHYGFKVDPTPPRAPKKKGKVESAVKYVKSSFFRPRGEMEVAVAQRELTRWVREIAGKREHGTTGKAPLHEFETHERAALLPLPAVPFTPVIWKKAKVHQDAHLVFDRRLYSVPWRHIGAEVWVRARGSTLELYVHDERVATHDRRGPGPRSTIEAHLPEQRAALRHRCRSYWEERADRIGPEVGAYIREVFDSDQQLSMLRTVQAIVTHLEGFPSQRARRACQRAQFYGSYNYGRIKSILRRALDLLPLPDESVPPAKPLASPRFARRLDELVQVSLEESHAPN